MADRTWNQVDARLYEEDWSAEARLVLGVLIARCPNPYGVYEIPILILKTLFTAEQIKLALKELSEMNSPPIKLYRGDKVIWITKKWKRAGQPTERQAKGAYNEVHGHFEEVWKDFLSLYPKWLAGYKGVSKGLKKSRKGFPSESDTESDTESESKRRKIPDGSATGQQAVALWVDLYRAEFDPDYKITKPGVGQINNAFKHLKKDLKEFERRARIYFADDWVRDNRPGESHFYKGIETSFKTGKGEDDQTGGLPKF